jgi:hypothetical protein
MSESTQRISPDDRDWSAALGRNCWRHAVIQRNAELYGLALDAFDIDDHARVNDLMLELVRIYKLAEASGIFTPTEAQALRQEWLFTFLSRCLLTMPIEERRAALSDPTLSWCLLPAERQLALLRGDGTNFEESAA